MMLMSKVLQNILLYNILITIEVYQYIKYLKTLNVNSYIPQEIYKKYNIY